MKDWALDIRRTAAKRLLDDHLDAGDLDAPPDSVIPIALRENMLWNDNQFKGGAICLTSFPEISRSAG